MVLRLTNDLEKINTTQKNKFSIKDFFSKGDQILKKLRIWSHLTKEILDGKLYSLRSESK